MVPTPSVLEMLQARGFRNLREWTHGVDTELFRFQQLPGSYPGLEEVRRPVSLFVGRISYEKNIEAFLDLELPGTKVVCGVGPVEAQLKARHPHVHWVGILPREQLAKLYAAADLFVFPSHADTFGLVMVEALACGTPVAAYPVDGPLTVLARRKEGGGRLGGAMHEDLQQACFAAMAVSRHEARARALDFSWAEATALFAGFLVPARGSAARGGSPAVVTQPS
jgi:glycosyltransferase involved in cell wall biosynthesis